VADSFDAPGTRRGIPFSEVAPSSKLGTVLTLSGLATEVSAREVGLDPDRLARLDRYLDNYVAAGRQKGSLIAICRGGKLAHVSMRGTRDEAAGLPVEADTVWRIYSMTKPITSVAAMMLYEEGALSLFDPVSKYIPSFEHVRVYRQGSAVSMVSAPAAEPMLIWHLLTHTAGLTYDFMFSHPVDELYRKTECDTISPYGPTLVQMCDRWASIPLLFEPGTSWNYSVGVDVLGRVVEVASGQSLDQFFSSRIFEPLGMRDTGFTMPESEAHRLSRLYMPDPKTGLAVLSPLDRPRTQKPNMLAGGAGLVSTASDYLRFTNMLLGRGELEGVRLLAPHTVDLMASNQLPGGALMGPPFGRPLLGVGNEGRGFGLGFSVLVDPIKARSISSRGEYAWGGAAGTAFWVDPAEELTVVFCTQGIFAMDDFSYTLRQLVYQALVG